MLIRRGAPAVGAPREEVDLGGQADREPIGAHDIGNATLEQERRILHRPARYRPVGAAYTQIR